MSNRLKPTLTFLSRTTAHFGPSVVACSVLMSLAACNSSKWHEVPKAPNTGDVFAERQIAAPPARPLRQGDPGFVSTDHLPVRTAPEQTPDEAPAHLERNDEIQVVSPPTEDGDDSMEAVVVSTHQPDLQGKHVFTSSKYIADKPVVPSNEENERDKYFVIQNIATEQLRVYLNCASKDASGACIHQMIFETEMVAGEDTPDKTRRSILGSYRIEKWFKFYEDHSHEFPSFYAPDYPDLPREGADLKDWVSPTRLPPKGGLMRGSFGWYTAYLEPNASNQWTHGTFGWGADGGKFIKAVKTSTENFGVDVRSNGCTRVENQAIALMREILPPGTRVIKIYAKEDYADKTLARYKARAQAKWNWVLTRQTTAAPKSGGLFTKDSDDILDHGSYVLDQTPTAIPFHSSKEGRNGNVYRLPESAMKGVLLVDEGLLIGYEHPAGLKVGGQKDHKLPSVVLSTRKNAAAVKPSVELEPANAE